MTNSINDKESDITQRAENWAQAEKLIRQKYNVWRKEKDLLPILIPGFEPVAES
jgi:hypothetical protein